jgi:ferredoxin
MKQALHDTGALLAGEMSGHMFFNDRFFGWDDALYAALRLAEILSRASAAPLSGLLAGWPRTYSTPGDPARGAGGDQVPGGGALPRPRCRDRSPPVRGTRPTARASTSGTAGPWCAPPTPRMRSPCASRLESEKRLAELRRLVRSPYPVSLPRVPAGVTGRRNRGSFRPSVLTSLHGAHMKVLQAVHMETVHRLSLPAPWPAPRLVHKLLSWDHAGNPHPGRQAHEHRVRGPALRGLRSPRPAPRPAHRAFNPCARRGGPRRTRPGAIRCGECARACPVDAILLSPVDATPYCVPALRPAAQPSARTTAWP